MSFHKTVAPEEEPVLSHFSFHFHHFFPFGASTHSLLSLPSLLVLALCYYFCERIRQARHFTAWGKKHFLQIEIHLWYHIPASFTNLYKKFPNDRSGWSAETVECKRNILRYLRIANICNCIFCLCFFKRIIEYGMFFFLIILRAISILLFVKKKLKLLTLNMLECGALTI